MSRVTDFSLRETWGYYEAEVANFVFEGLTLLEPDGLAPGLATSWSTDDGRVYRFGLRHGVHFHDGTEFSAADVVRAWTDALRSTPTGITHPWALDPIRGAQAFARGEASEIAGLRVIDDTTIVIELIEPLSFFPTLLAVPHAAIPAVSAGPRRPVGTGPWRWVSGDGRTSNVIAFGRNDDYWGGSANLDSLLYVFVPDSLVQDAFESGLIDFVSDVRPATRLRWRTRADVGFRESEAITSSRLVLNFLEPVFQDVRVRQGLNHAISVAQLATGVGAPNPVRAAGAIPPSMLTGDLTRQPYEYDPELARQLLEEGGYPFDRPLRIWVPPPGLVDYPEGIGPLLVDYLEAVGLSVELTVRSEGLETALTRRLADITLSVWVGDFMDPDAYLFPLYHSQSVGTAGNEGWFADVEVDAFIDQSRRVSDTAERHELLQRADSLIFERAPAVFLWFTSTATAYSLRLEGWGPDPMLSRALHLRVRR